MGAFRSPPTPFGFFRSVEEETSGIKTAELFAFFRRFGRGLDHPVGNFKQDGIQRFRPPVQETLAQLTADIPQELPLFRRFDSFRQGMDLHAVRDVDHRFDDLPVQASAGIQILNQRHVELDQVDFKAAENVQRGIAAAEIVDPELVSHFPQAAQLGLEALGGGGDIPLGNLHDSGDKGLRFLPEYPGN